MDLKSSNLVSKLLGTASPATIEFELDQGSPFHLISVNYSDDRFYINPKISQVFFNSIF